MDKFWMQVAQGLKAQYGGEWTVGPGVDSGSTVWHADGITLTEEQEAAITHVLQAVSNARRQTSQPGDGFGQWLRRAVKSGMSNWSIPGESLIGLGLEHPFGFIWIKSHDHLEDTILQSLLNRYFADFLYVHVYQIDDDEWIVLLPSTKSTRVSAMLEQMLEHAQGIHAVLLEELGQHSFILAERPKRWFRSSGGDVDRDGSTLLQAIFALKRMGQWVKQWIPEEPVHGIWAFQTEQLIMSLSAAQQVQWLNQLGAMAKWHQVLADDEELEQTIRVWLQSDANSSEASKRLFIHRNTLLYRLEKIHTQFGLDPRRLEDLMLLRIGLILYKLHKK